jgi:hypothetical protein
MILQREEILLSLEDSLGIESETAKGTFLNEYGKLRGKIRGSLGFLIGFGVD